MSNRTIRKSEVELIEMYKEKVDASWDALTRWEKDFVEDIIARYNIYGKSMFVSDNVINRLLEISEKIL